MHTHQNNYDLVLVHNDDGINGVDDDEQKTDGSLRVKDCDYNCVCQLDCSLNNDAGIQVVMKQMKPVDGHHVVMNK